MHRIEKRKVKDLAAAPYNPRRISERAFTGLRESVRRFGLVQPIIVNERTGNIVGGHQRAKALEAEGVKDADVILVDIAEGEEKALNVALNNGAISGEFTDDVFGLLNEIEQENKELFDALLLGDVEIDVGGVKLDPQEVEEDEVPEPPKNPVTKLGDVWVLGDHRLVCGDCTKDLEVATAGEKAPLVLTDPPYNVAERSRNYAASAEPASYGALKSAKWDSGFDPVEALDALKDAAADACTFYVFTSLFLAGEIWAWMDDRLGFHGYCVWNKPNPMPSLAKRHWTWAAELVCYGASKGHTFNFPVEGHASNVWTFNKTASAAKAGHPTSKPVEVMAHPMKHSSNKGDLVLDGFGGSGSTLIAAEQIERRCAMTEIDPAYCDVIVERWENLTGKKAQRG